MSDDPALLPPPAHRGYAGTSPALLPPPAHRGYAGTSPALLPETSRSPAPASKVRGPCMGATSQVERAVAELFDGAIVGHWFGDVSGSGMVVRAGMPALPFWPKVAPWTAVGVACACHGATFRRSRVSPAGWAVSQTCCSLRRDESGFATPARPPRLRRDKSGFAAAGTRTVTGVRRPTLSETPRSPAQASGR